MRNKASRGKILSHPGRAISKALQIIWVGCAIQRRFHILNQSRPEQFDGLLNCSVYCYIDARINDYLTTAAAAAAAARRSLADDAAV